MATINTGWVSFNCKNTGNSGNEVSDGQVEFSGTTDDTTGNLLTAQLSYSKSENSNPHPDITFTFPINSALSPNNGTFSLPDPPTAAKSFEIPSKGTFNGGLYNTLTGATYAPTGNKLHGVFTEIGGEGGSDDCTFDASTTSGTGAQAHHTGY